MAVVILAYNEEANITAAVSSVVEWASEVVVVDSFSTDATVDRARRAGATVVQHAFVDYAAQRNFALRELQTKSPWLFFLDADEWVTKELAREIRTIVSSTAAPHAGYRVRFRLMWNGTWIRRGYYPTWILRLVLKQRARCEPREVNEHLVVDGSVGLLAGDLMHEDRKGVGSWIAKHNDYATREARELMRARLPSEQLPAGIFGSQAERKRWIRLRIWNRLPPLLRPLAYFVYRYILAGGFLDGRQALAYHVLHALWFPMVIDLKYLEMRRGSKGETPEADGSPSGDRDFQGVR